MIFTVVASEPGETAPWRAALLEYSWGRVTQPGELVRLVAGGAQPGMARYRLARVVPTLGWVPHPYTGDAYPPYAIAGAVLEWLVTERVDGTVLLLDERIVFRAAMSTEVEAGQARGTAWTGLPQAGAGPFGLGAAYDFLERFCVDRTLALPAVALPVVIHAHELRRLAPRWLELMSIIRAETAERPDGPAIDADKVAYAIAAAEAAVPHTVAGLAVTADAEDGTAPLFDYGRPIVTPDGEVVWDAATYDGETPAASERARPGAGRGFLELLRAFAAGYQAGGALAFLRPRRRRGVREGRVLDHTLLEIPGRADTLSLNPSAAAVWGLCDGRRSLAELTRELEGRFEMPRGSLGADVQTVIDRLEGVGAIELAPV